MRYSNEFYFVTPAALVSAAEIPAECGLLVVVTATRYDFRFGCDTTEAQLKVLEPFAVLDLSL